MNKKYRLLSAFALFVITVMLFSRIIYDHKVELLVQSQIRQLVVFYPGVKISYKSLETQSNGDVILHHLKINNSKSGRSVQAKSVIFHDFDRLNKVPKYLNVSVEELQLSVIPADNPEENFIGLTQLGLENMQLSLSFAYHYDEFTHRIKFNTVVDVKEAAQVYLNLEFANFDYDQLKYYRSNMNSLLFIRGEMTYIEQGILPRFIHYKAQQMHQTEKQLLMSMVNKLELSMQQAIKNDQPNISRLYQSGKVFLQQQKQLKLSAHEEHGLSFKKIKALMSNGADREKLTALLNIQLTAHKSTLVSNETDNKKQHKIQ
ncbi:MAG: hypothetical protein GY694_18880 [Gammaproteobacteria bacterium]|nr:hypothetical protein [Gammaproteobacteria bacterium]